MHEPSTVERAHGEPRRLAAHHARFFAVLIDYLLVLTLLKLQEQLFLGADWDLAVVRGASAASQTTHWWVPLVLVLLLKDGWSGRGPGKWICGLTVRCADDLTQRPKLWRLWLRNVTLPLLPLEMGWAWFHPRSRRLGDLWARTVVIETPSPIPLPRRLLVLTSVLMTLLLASFLVVPWNVKRSAAYREAVAVLQREAALEGGSALEIGWQTDLQLRADAQPPQVVLTFDVSSAEGADDAREVVVTLFYEDGAWQLQDRQATGEESEESDDRAP